MTRKPRKVVPNDKQIEISRPFVGKALEVSTVNIVKTREFSVN